MRQGADSATCPWPLCALVLSLATAGLPVLTFEGHRQPLLPTVCQGEAPGRPSHLLERGNSPAVGGLPFTACEQAGHGSSLSRRAELLIGPT